MRFFRLFFGVAAAVQFIETQEIMVGLIAIFFLYQAISNTGCGVNGCDTPINKNHKKNIEDINFEEVK